MENLWDRHPPFQIDGNFGYTAGVSELLLGSYDGFVLPLQALPPEWSSGEYSGLVARGGVVFDCRWQDGEITYLTAIAKHDVAVDIHLPSGKTLTVSLKANKKTLLIEKGN